MSTIAAGLTSTNALVNTGDTSGQLVFQTNGTTTAMTIDTSQNVGIGTSSPSAKLDIASGNLSFSGSAQRITGDFSNATIANRVAFQTSTTNGATALSVIPNGTNTVSLFRAYNNSDLTNGSYLTMQALSTEVSIQSSYGGTGSYLPMTFYTGGSERMRIDSSGNVGIGTSTPSARIHAYSTSTTSIKSQSSGDYSAYFLAINSGGNFYLASDNSTGAGFGSPNGVSLYSNKSGPMTFWQNNTERMRIDANGNLLVGSSSNPATACIYAYQSINAAVIHGVSGNANFTGTLFYGQTTRAANSGFDLIGIYSNSVGQFRVSGTGVIYAQNTTVQSISDIRLKENIKDAKEGLDVICSLRPVRYDWKTGYGNDQKNQLGFIAQEVESVFPEAVSEWQVNKDDETIYKTIGQSAFIPLLVKAIQEQQAIINELKSRIETLENK